METIALVIATVSSIVVILNWFGVSPKTMTEKRPTIYIMALLMVLTWGAVGFDYYDRHSSTTTENGVTFINKDAWDHYAINQVWSKTFANQTVPLDGYEYVDCTFNNVTFEYDGTAPSRVTNGHFTKGSQVRFLSKNAVVDQTMLIMSTFAQLTGGTSSAIQCGPLPNTP